MSNTASRVTSYFENSIVWLIAILSSFLVYLYTLTFVLYPAELEWREGTNWLHAIAQARGTNIFDFSNYAYVNAGHGIADHLLKAILIKIAPFLPNSAILRFFVLLLPPVLTIAFYAALNRTTSQTQRIATALLWSAFILIILHLVGFWYTCLGRPDATAYVFLTLGFIGCLPTFRERFPVVSMFLTPFCAAFLIFINWRIAPLAMLLPVLQIKGPCRASIRYLLHFCATTLLIFLLLSAVFIQGWFDGSSERFTRYFFGFFLGKSGWGGDAAVPLSVLLQHIREPAILVLIILCFTPLIPAIYRRHLGFAADSLIPAVAVVLGLFICALALKLNFKAGGPWYYGPSLLLFGFFVVSRYSIGPRLASIAVLAAFGLVFISPRYDTMSYLSKEVYRSFGAATLHMEALRKLDQKFRITSDEFHLFRQDHPLPPVDMGDTAEAISKSNFLGDAFTKTFRDYAEGLAQKPPAVILIGACSSSALRSLIDSGEYELLGSSPPPFTLAKLYVHKANSSEAKQLLLFPGH